MSRLVVVGDALLDRDLDGRAERLAPDAPVPVIDAIAPRERPGGAGLAALLAARDGHAVTLVCALGADPAGARVRELLAAAGVAVCDLGLLGGETPEKARVLAGGRPVVRLDRGGGTGCGPLTTEARTALAEADAVLVSDYGRGVAAAADVRAALGAAPVVWDPHPRGPAPVPGCVLVTPNASEAARFAGEPSVGIAGAEACARVLRERWQAVAVAVTRGAGGALLVAGPGPALAAPAEPAAGGDPCGAGDRFAATAAGRIAAGDLPTAAVVAAVAAASRFVAEGGAASVRRAPQPRRAGDARALAARVRAEGGTVVATGGCFDLLHAGHVRALQAARALGDCLIVCLNSDASVRRRKGPDRPLTGADDRGAILAALGCVDAVVVFEEDDPRAVLREIRPHVWAKGGDYARRRPARGGDARRVGRARRARPLRRRPLDHEPDRRGPAHGPRGESPCPLISAPSSSPAARRASAPPSSPPSPKRAGRPSSSTGNRRRTATRTRRSTSPTAAPPRRRSAPSPRRTAASTPSSRPRAPTRAATSSTSTPTPGIASSPSTCSAPPRSSARRCRRWRPRAGASSPSPRPWACARCPPRPPTAPASSASSASRVRSRARWATASA